MPRLLKPISEAQAMSIVADRRLQAALRALPVPKDGKDGKDGTTTKVTREVLANKEKLLGKEEFEKFKEQMMRMESDIRQSLGKTHNYFPGGGQQDLVNLITVTEDTTIRAKRLLSTKYNVILVMTAGITVTMPANTGTKVIEIKQGFTGSGTYTICKETS